MAANLQIPNRESLLLPDKITPYDNLELPPPPDASWLLSQADEGVKATPVGRKGRPSNNRDINLQEDFDNSQFLQGTSNAEEDALAPMEDLDLELDFGMDMDGTTMEVGRDAPAARDVEDDIFSELDMATRKDGRETSLALDFGDDGVHIADGEGDILMGDDEDLNFNIHDQSEMPDVGGLPNRARISESPLSDINEDVEAQVAQDVAHNHTDLYEPADETDMTIVRRPAQRAKKQKLMMPDEEIALTSAYIRKQQEDRQQITKPYAFIPRDPMLLALMDMQKSGAFVSSVMSEGRSLGWAPELRGMLSMDMIRGATDLKRKRDSGIADVDSDNGVKSPRLDLGDDTEAGTVLHLGDDGMDDMDDSMPAFDDTVAPNVHPADSGPVSVGTKHAVHILRELFGSEAAINDEKRKKTSVVFQDLLPENQTTKAEATKMFFECLVLATKDAIKVEQGADLGDPIRVRGKRGLWGDWAEREAGGEIENQDENAPTPAATSAPTVAVEA